ncbi:MAG: phosphoribosylanthranilate isomerase [Bacteroidetes bacterium]|nr:MAG: phosphoribosylanthranilate isomerase [Bacteroidota bacterium]TAG85414.1 MAG: phosphoribosylanthranilate isomerase [Bacteroidota bacterium]
MNITDLQIKICGMTDTENIQAVAKQIKPDYMGFIFYEKSKRFVTENFILPEIHQDIKKVGVFVNPTLEYLEKTIEKYALHAIQLHAEESPELCAYIKQKYQNLMLIKVFSVAENFDFEICEPYQNIADFFLWDTKGKQYGGNGTTFDWKILDKYKGNKKNFISGGINTENLKDLLSFLDATPNKSIIGIDVNSGFEIKPALKNIQQLQILKKS